MKRKFAVNVLCLCLSISIATTANASSYSNQIESAQGEKESIEESLSQAKEEVENMQSSKGSLETYLADLTSQVDTVNTELSDIETQLDNKQAEIQTTTQLLEEAKATEKTQYESMKKRIKYLYENGSTTYLEVLINAADFSDLVNKAEYIATLTEYDRDMLYAYQDTKETIAKKETELKEEEEDLIQLKADVESKKSELSALVNSTSVEIAKYDVDISTSQNIVDQYESELLAQEAELNNLKYAQESEAQSIEAASIEQASKEAVEESIKAESSKEAAKDQTQAETKSDYNETEPSNETDSSGSGDDNNIVDTSTKSELDVLAAIIYCEAGGESYLGKVAVGAVVMNRVNSSRYPNDILSVVTQPGQFSPVASGRFYIVLARGANSTCYDAAREAMALGCPTIGDVLFFRTIIDGIDGTIIGNHIFY